MATGVVKKQIIIGSKTVTANGNAYGSEAVNVPWGNTDYSCFLSTQYASGFTNAILAYRYKSGTSIAVGFYNNSSSPLTLTIDYALIHG